MKKVYLLGLIMVIIVLSSCQKLFEFSPYESNLPDGYKSTTEKQLGKLSIMKFKDQDTIVVDLISDSHVFHKELREVVNRINDDRKADLVMHLGDFMDGGYQQEYIYSHELMDRLSVPWLTVIGNHDCLSNGESVYKAMFGYEQYEFDLREWHIIVWNSVVWELGDRTPDLNWLERKLAAVKGQNIIVATHIPSWDDQLRERWGDQFENIIAKYGVKIVLLGHEHTYSLASPFENSIPHLVVGSVSNRAFVRLKLAGNRYFLQQMKL